MRTVIGHAPLACRRSPFERPTQRGVGPPIYFDRPYYVAPLKGSGKVYALLRDALVTPPGSRASKVRPPRVLDLMAALKRSVERKRKSA